MSITRHPGPAMMVAILAVCAPVDPGFAEVDPSECTLEIQNMIEQTRRLEITLGEQADVQGALLEFGEKLVGELELSGAAGALRDATVEAVEAGRLVVAVDENVGRSDYMGAAGDVTAFLVDRVSAQSDHSWLGRYVKGLPEGQRAKLRETLGQVLDDDAPFVEALKTGNELDLGTLAANLTTEEYQEAARAVTMFAAKLVFPGVEGFKAAVDLAHVAASAGRDWIANEEVGAMFAAYKDAHDNYSDWRTAYETDPRLRYTNVAYEKTRQMILSLEKAKDPQADEGQHISDGEVETFLFEQFESWRRAEKQGEADADRLALARKSYFTLDPLCRSYLNRRRWPEGRSGLERVTKGVTDQCYFERERFGSYADLYLRTHDQLYQDWYRPGTKCSTPGMFQLKVQHIACSELAEPDRGIAYRQAIQNTLEDCGWLPPYEARVVDSESGAAVAGASVSVESERVVSFPEREVQRAAVTGADGSLSLPNVPLGLYRVVVDAEGYEPSGPREARLLDRHAVAQHFRLRPSQPVDSAPRMNSGTVRALVLDAVTSEPLPGATVSLEGAEAGLLDTTDARGRVELRDLPLGSYTITANLEGYEPHTPVRLELGPKPMSGTLRLKPRDERIEPAAAVLPPEPDPGPDDDRALMEDLCVCIFQDSYGAENKALDQIRNSKWDKLDYFEVRVAPGYDPGTDRCFGRWESKYTDSYNTSYHGSFDWSRSGIPNPPRGYNEHRPPKDRCCTVFKVRGDKTVCWTEAN